MKKKVIIKDNSIKPYVEIKFNGKTIFGDSYISGSDLSDILEAIGYDGEIETLDIDCDG